MNDIEKVPDPFSPLFALFLKTILTSEGIC